MEIVNKESFKAAFRELVEKYIRQFPFYFWFNILINLIIIGLLTTIAVAAVATFSSQYQDPGIIGNLWPFVILLVSISYITLESFFKNMHILHELREIHHDLGIKDYEWDHVMHFIEDLPMKTEDVERMKVTLSYGKIIRLLDLFEMITFEGGMCHLDRVFRHKIEMLMERGKISIER